MPDVIVADLNGDALRLIDKVAGEIPIIVVLSQHDLLEMVRKLAI